MIFFITIYKLSINKLNPNYSNMSLEVSYIFYVLFLIVYSLAELSNYRFESLTLSVYTKIQIQNP